MRPLPLKIPFYYSFYHFGWPKILPINYTLSLSFRCNSRCQTCNIWQKKNNAELNIDEWKKVFYSLGKSPYWVTLSGGEPFLKTDLVEIVKSLYQICQPRIVTIPTNGLLTKKISERVKEMVKSCPKTRFIVNLSLDGLEEKHDKIRGVKGNFEKTMATYQNLKKITAANFTLGIHTVISKQNVNDFSEICDFVLGQLRPDSYVTEIAEERVELENVGKRIIPDLNDYKKAIDYLQDKIKESKAKGLARLTKAFRITYYDLAEKTIQRKSQVIPCYAGVASAQIAPNGDVWPCCVRADILGNLKKENFDFKKIWFSPRTDKIRKSIKGKKCACPLANACYTNILFNPKQASKVVAGIFQK